MTCSKTCHSISELFYNLSQGSSRFPSGFALGKSLGAALPAFGKTLSFPPLLLRLTQYVGKILDWYSNTSGSLGQTTFSSHLEETYKDKEKYVYTFIFTINLTLQYLKKKNVRLSSTVQHLC